MDTIWYAMCRTNFIKSKQKELFCGIFNKYRYISGDVQQHTANELSTVQEQLGWLQSRNK